MRRRLLVVTAVFVAVFAATYAVTWATGSSVSTAVVVTVVVGFLWIVARDVRRKPWPSESQRSHDAAYAAVALAAMHGPGQGGTDCPSSPGDVGGFGDCGAGGL